ncbi:MAG: hypothetical protein Q4C95_05915 [Planctomycetia bacterium]|nr:hypothetical protein [Planctomycetia bacterium]
MDGRQIRINRMFTENKCVVIAVDHGFFDGPIPYMENLPETVKKINPVVDAVLIAPGMLRHCQSIFAQPKSPLAVVRLNWNTVYCFHLNYRKARSIYAYDVKDAFREGMDVALVSLTLRTGDEERDAENVENFANLVNQAHELGIPVIGEYFPTGHMDMTPDELHDDVLLGARVVAELGADLIKTFNTKDFAKVTESCPVPVLGLGAEKLPTMLDALKLAEKEAKAGAGGVVFGRNAIQVSKPFEFQQALCDVVRYGLAPEEAVAKYGLK